MQVAKYGTTFNMVHKMGLVKITLGTKSVPTTRNYSASGSQAADATGMKYTDSGTTTVTASNSFDTSCSPYSSLGYWYIVRGSKTGTSYTKTFKSVTTVNTDWEYADVSVNEGNFQEITIQNNYIKRLCYKFTAVFSCTQTCQEFKLPVKGTMTIQCWGAKGATLPGATASNIYKSASANLLSGGNGGYVSGSISTLEHYRILYIYVGKQGMANVNAKTFNGGGSCLVVKNVSTDVHASGQGGGATDIRLAKHSYGSWGYKMENDEMFIDDSFCSRLIVAGGGGSADQYVAYTGAIAESNSHGGDAGGLKGYSGNKAGTSTYWSTLTVAGGGTQTSVGVGGSNGGYGVGADNSFGGGGGGYYGGGGGGSVNGCTSSGAGGSSYVSGHGGCTSLSYGGKTYTFSSPEIWDGLGYKWNSSAATSTRGFPTTSGSSTENGHSGDGYAKITMTTPDAD